MVKFQKKGQYLLDEEVRIVGNYIDGEVGRIIYD